MEKELEEKGSSTIETNLISKFMPLVNDICCYDYNESKITSIYDILDSVYNNSEDKDEINKMLKEIYISLPNFELDNSPNTRNRFSYKKNRIYRITGEIGEDLYISYNKETDYLTYIISPINKIKNRMDLKKSFGRSIHSNDLGKEMELIKKINK